MLWLYSKNNSIKMFKKILKDMEKKDFKIEHLFYQASLTADQTECIYEMLLQVMGKNFVPVKPPEMDQLSYPPLVREFYGERVRKSDAIKNDGKSLFSEKKLGELLDRQLKMEKEGGVYIENIATVDESEDDSANRTIEELQSEWKKVLVEKIENEVASYWTKISKITSNKAHHSCLYHVRIIPKHLPFLALLPPEEWATIVLDELVPLMQQPDGISVQYLCYKMQNLAWKKYAIARKIETGTIDKISLMYLEYIKFLNSEETSYTMSRDFWSNCASSHILSGSLSVDVPVWTAKVAHNVFGTLLYYVVNLLYLQENNAAFQHVYETVDTCKIKGVIKPNINLVNLIRKSTKKNKESIKMDTESLPMFVPPRPWVTVKDGCYLGTPDNVMRADKDVYQHQLLLQETKNPNPLLDALNYLGSCPWKINEKILDLQLKLFNSKDNYEDLEIPYEINDPLPDVPRDASVEERYKVTNERQQLQKKQREAHSLWMDKLYKLSLANHLRHDIFWLPHDIDFRGRAYAMPPHISHLSSDSNRALLLFAVGKPLGDKGLDWLKIHMVNLHGEKKKLSLQGRLEFANEMLSEVFDSAEKPLTGNKWWQTSDEPWQMLACCMEIVNAIRSGDPASFVSHQPVHQDGSCNGLQHYAALGRDSLGAEQVNLTPQDIPADLYSTVAKMVDKRRAKDAAKGKVEAQILEGKIHRKVVKQTVMTVVYGVTWVGGREQIGRQLKGTIPDEDVYDCSSYLVGLVFDSLATAFKNARQIQDWLSESARKIAKAGHPVQWTTPMGLPVIQPYHKDKQKYVKTKLQLIYRSEIEITNPPSVRRQKMAMPPNFVHSIDSTHMMLTALNCQRSGISFVAVHDCFWTHACSVDEMNKFCREQFVALHSSPILENLAEEFEENFGHLTYKEESSKKSPTGHPGVLQCSFKDSLPGKGDFDLKEVMKSVYFFS
ncbi:DNA-directed RNA polymerase, mitochondrial-like isoform X2 [Dysidea avara]